jgi:16S rRNA (cytidine1402-2'-O)-methyltransferase
MSETIEPGALYLVSTPIGNMEDITYRAVHILSSVQVIAAEDTRKTKLLLDHYNIHTPMVSYYSYNEEMRAPQLVERMQRGDAVAVVTDAGTPGISDPAFHVVQHALAAGIRIIPIPGASAVLSALVAGGLPTDRFVFEGFLPLKKGRKTKFEAMKSELRTMVIYESPFRVVRTLEDIQIYLGNRQVVVARELTKKFEEILRGTVEEILEQIKERTQKGEFVILIAGAGKPVVEERELGGACKEELDEEV